MTKNFSEEIILQEKAITFPLREVGIFRVQNLEILLISKSQKTVTKIKVGLSLGLRVEGVVLEVEEPVEEFKVEKMARFKGQAQRAMTNAPMET